LSNSIKIYRIVKTKWQAKAFDGEGARLFGGRWNSKANPCVYCASTESLAQLEMLVHMQKTSLLNHYTLFEVCLTSSQVMTLQTVPENWQDDPAPPDTAILGDKWLNDNNSVAFKVPSVIVSREVNYLLNPQHSDFPSIVNSAITQPVRFDIRLK
jgi:RES domain-containing protein